MSDPTTQPPVTSTPPPRHPLLLLRSRLCFNWPRPWFLLPRLPSRPNHPPRLLWTTRPNSKRWHSPP